MFLVNRGEDTVGLFEKVRDKIRDVVAKIDDPEKEKNKYSVKLDEFIAREWAAFQRHGLDKIRPIRILEIGPAMGYLMAFCQEYGHKIEVIEMPDSSLYLKSLQALGIYTHSYVMTMDKMFPDSLTSEFELIYATGIQFDCLGEMCAYRWPTDKWLEMMNLLMDRTTWRVFLARNWEYEGGRAMVKFFNDPRFRAFLSTDRRVKSFKLDPPTLSIQKVGQLVGLPS